MEEIEIIDASLLIEKKSGFTTIFSIIEYPPAVEQCDISAGLDRQIQVRDARGVGTARIAEDDLERRVGGFRVLDAPEQRLLFRGQRRRGHCNMLFARRRSPARADGSPGDRRINWPGGRGGCR